MVAEDIEALHKRLLQEWGSRNRDMKQVQKLLEQFQNLMFEPLPLKPLSESALFTIFKDYYELSVLYQVLDGNMEQFESAIKETLQFYANYAGKYQSQQQYLMIGLYLMYLLASNKISEFHMMMEQIEREKRLQDPFLDMPIKLERYLTEGAYNKMMMSEKNLPSPYYKPFVNTLKQAVQNEIAVGLEKSYRSIPIKNAMKLLFIESEPEALAFGTRRGWIHQAGSFLITTPSTEMDTGEQPAKLTLALPSGAERVLQPLDCSRLIRQCLHYAGQLEQII